MAPVTVTSVGITPQIIDDPKLVGLLEKLNGLQLVDVENESSTARHTPPCDIEALVAELEKWPSWRFEEQADLHNWIHPLNAIDASLSYLVRMYPALLLIAPLKKKHEVQTTDRQTQRPPRQAESAQDIAAVPESVVKSVCTLLGFLSCLLKNSVSKSVFNSVEELTDLLAATHDEVAARALDALCSLATPPSLHKQQSPEVHQHTSALHSPKSNAHRRLIALARGWGSRGSGLGLFACVTADDSEHGQGALPVEAGELSFEFFSGKDVAKTDGNPPANRLVRIHLSSQDMCNDVGQADDMVESSNADDGVECSKQKRRRTESTSTRRRGMETKQTHNLFFRCLEQTGGRSCVPEDRLFSLLAGIRLAKAFHSNASRVQAVERRLRALTTILHAHPSQDIMSGYFHAQPELCIELIDLLRPTVSSASVSAASARPKHSSGLKTGNDLYAISSLAQSPVVPYTVRTLAVEALTALVARRDGTTGGLTGVARQSSVLSELGVAKGQYLGLLPTLIRYSLASLSSFLSNDKNPDQPGKRESDELETMDLDEDSFSLEVGLAFLEATKPPAMPLQEQLEYALEFIDAVLTLTSAVVSAPSGTAALTDCGLVPALLSTVATHSHVPKGAGDVDSTSSTSDVLSYSNCLLRFITAQAIQIIEGAIVTHNNALSAFHDLHGVNILISRLHREIEEVCHDGGHSSDAASLPASIDDRTPMEIDGTSSERRSGRPSLSSARRVLLFSIMNCLTVVFHQESTSSSPSAPSAGAQLRKPELTGALIDIMENISSYGGALAALTSSLLSDVMNSDPQVVHHVHNSGLASSFLKMLMGENNGSSNEEDQWVPPLPPVPELIMALPNVISALALTEDGAKAIRQADPFPALLSLFHHPKYAMPRSRCLLNELTAIVGTGLDEICRHVPSLRPLVMSAIVKAMSQVVTCGQNLVRMEEEEQGQGSSAGECGSSLENDRTCLIQYALNYGQILEQVLHNEDSCGPFVDAGGLDVALELFPLLIPTNSQFLAHTSCLSCPSVSTLNHSTTEESLTIAIKSTAVHYDSHKMLKKMISAVNNHLNVLEESQKEVRRVFSVSLKSSDGEDQTIDSELYAGGILERLPRVPIHTLPQSTEMLKQKRVLSKYLRDVATMQWLTNILSGVIRAACQRSQDAGTGWGRSEREWKKELSSSSFAQLVQRLSLFHQSSLLETCRIRSEEKFDAREKDRLLPESRKVRYRLRIVCQEGAVVRDGIEIDSCASVGSMEMGEIVNAFDRCINSSGVLRYRTRRGWVSELTRGHGREPIAEVVSVWIDEKDCSSMEDATDAKAKRTECGVPGIASVCASILARLQNSYGDFFASLSRLVIQGFRSLQVRSMSFQDGTIGAHVGAVVKVISSTIEQSFNLRPISAIIMKSQQSGKSEESTCQVMNEAGASMYLGCIFGHLHACLFLEKRERRMVNVPLLLLMMKSKEDGDKSQNATMVSFFDLVRFVLNHSLVDAADRGSTSCSKEAPKTEDHNEVQTVKGRTQSVGRSVAASFPPTIALLGRLTSASLITSSPVTSVMSRMNGKDLSALIGESSFSALRALEGTEKTVDTISFVPERVVSALQCTIAEAALKTWVDPRLIWFPPHLIHPFSSMVREIITSLELASKKAVVRSVSRAGDGAQVNQWDIFSRSASSHIRRQRLGSNNEDDRGEGDAEPPFQFRSRREDRFEPNEEAVSRLMEMGFGRDHALDALESTRSNRLEIAMEYALSHPPPSPGTVERRRAAREERRRQREEREERSRNASSGADPMGTDDTSHHSAVGETSTSNNDVVSSRQESDRMDVDDEQATAEASAVDEQSTAEAPSSTSVAGKTDKMGDTYDDLVKERAKTCLRSWVDKGPAVAIDILSRSFDNNGKVETILQVDDGTGTGNAESEALTVVLCSFLLDLCHRYPDERSKIVVQLLRRLKSQIDETAVGGVAECSVVDGHESSLAALTHASVLFMRALPRSRLKVLEQGLVRSLVTLIDSYSSHSLIKKCGSSAEPLSNCEPGSAPLSTKWPMWLAPALLLLDVMAQPLAVFPDSIKIPSSEGKEGVSFPKKEELGQVREEHEKQAAALSETALLIFSAVTSTASKQRKKKGPEDSTNPAGSSSEGVESDMGGNNNIDSTPENPKSSSSDRSSPFSSVPPYFPLMPLDSSEMCMKLCLRLLGKGQGGVETPRVFSPPPGVVHATLLLLSRVLRSPKLASQCLRMGAAELVLNLPRECRFTGNSGLVTIVLKRLLEDEQTLQAGMETEIRSTVSKLHRKQRRSLPLNDERPSVTCHSFVQAVKPLICRDPATFLKAAASSLCIETDLSSSANRQPMIVLLAVDQRAQNVKALSEALGHRGATHSSSGGRIAVQKASTGSTISQRRGRLPNASKSPSKATKSKSPHPRRSSHSKKSRKDRNEAAGVIKKYVVLNGTPANHVTALLITRLTVLYQQSSSLSSAPSQGSKESAELFGEGTAFVWIADLLEILSDLVLAVPACAAAIHRFRPSKDRWAKTHSMVTLHHALSSCSHPQKNFVSFLLHRLLPQDRWSFLKNQNNSDSQSLSPEADLIRRKNAFMKKRVSRTSARLLVALVARAGEGRRRVVTDLVYALSGGHLGSVAPLPAATVTVNESFQGHDSELFALQSWGELVMGLAAPRGNGANHDSNASLSLEVVKLMLEGGIVHALMYGIQRVQLQHPMAATACGALLIPLEVFTRYSVTEAIQTMADKEAADKKKNTRMEDVSAKAAKKKRPSDSELSRGVSQRSESAFADDAMLEDGFDAETAARTSRTARTQAVALMDDTVYGNEIDEVDDHMMGEYEGEIDDDDDEEMEGDDIDDSDSDEDSEEEINEDISSEEGSNDTEDVEEAESENSTEDDEVESESDEGSEGDDSEDDDEDDTDTGWNDEYNEDFFDGNNMNEEEIEDQRLGGPSESDMEDGWTRIESGGFGGMLLGSRQNARSGTGNMSARTRGFIDAAEAMIGTLLRTGEIQGDALVQIEDTLGIRIMQHRGVPELDQENREGNLGLSSSSRHSSVERSGSQRSRDGQIVGTVPHVHQRTPPEVGYTALGGGSREISSMDYVFGGPSVSAGSPNYDIVSPRSPLQEESYPNPSPVDAHLFPGGPAASTHARAQHSLHPLLCGVDLPPVNALVSDLLPHGEREIQRSQANTRRSGEFNSSSMSGAFLFSTSNGSVIRLNRGLGGTPFAENAPSQDRNGLLGWTDDGLPFDGNIGEFSDAFERALAEWSNMSSTAPDGSTPQSSNAVSGETVGVQTPSSSPAVTSETAPTAAHEDGSDATAEQRERGDQTSGISTAHETASESGAVVTGTETSHIASASTANEASERISEEQNTSGGNEGNSTTSEGDGVASSLAEGLRLSPRSESSQNSDQMSTSNIMAASVVAQEDTPCRQEDNPDIPSGDPVVRTTELGEDDTENVQMSDGGGGDHACESSTREENDISTDVIDEQGEAEASNPNDAAQTSTESQNEPNGNGLVCPPGMDLEVFNSLPLEMQQEVVEQHQSTTELAAVSGLDPEALAALPEEMRREVIEQEQQARRQREQPPADISNAEEMDNANFVASLAPELREEILLTADDAFLNSLPQNIIAEAHVLRERASTRHRRFHDDDPEARPSVRGVGTRGNARSNATNPSGAGLTDRGTNSSARKRLRSGKLRVECERPQVVYLPSIGSKLLTPPFAKSDLKALIRLMYLLSPVRPQRLLQKVIQNLCAISKLRGILSTSFVRLLNDDGNGAVATIDTIERDYLKGDDWRRRIDDEFAASIGEFPPPILIGAAPEVLDSESMSPNVLFRRRNGGSTAASIAANLPTTARGSSRDRYLPPVVAARIIDTLSQMSKNSPRICLDLLASPIVYVAGSAEREVGFTCFDVLLDLIPLYAKSASNLEQLLNLLETVVSPLSLVPKDGDEELEISQRDHDAAAAAGKEWVEVPRIAVSQSRLQLLCSVLRMESCRDSAFVKVNIIARRLCRVKANRACILAELASVAQALGTDAIRDLRALNIRMTDAVKLHQDRLPTAGQGAAANSGGDTNSRTAVLAAGRASSSVTLSTSSSELKLLRVLQTLQGLCIDNSQEDDGGKKNDGGVIITEELVELLQGMNLDDLWGQLSSCLKVVQVLEGVASVEEVEEGDMSESGERPMETDEDDGSDGSRSRGKKLQNSVAGLLTRFLPTIEAFFVANASAMRISTSEKVKDTSSGDSSESNDKKEGEGGSCHARKSVSSSDETDLDSLVGGRRLVAFVAANKVLLNALIRNNPGLLEKGLRAMVQVSRCRVFLDFDVKRQWFKTQVRRLRQHASRRHGSLRLNIRRKYVFQDAYDQLRIRNADEMRGRLHITFQNEEGVDAGGLSREFFGILAKEIFNPNYALFTSTEDGCTFQPNPNSSINPDHLSYFRFVGRIVGKAVSDGFLLDAHFTRSLYKHMLGMKPTHDDMEAIDPDYYKNLKMILEYNLGDIGLDLTFSTEDHSFGRSQIIDLIPDGRRTAVTEETKAKYVSLVCQHRMTTAIESQIKAYLDGFYELVSRDLITIFTPKELELLISGLPDIDVHDLRRNTDYQGYKSTDKEIGWFWNVLFSLSRSEKAAFLQFVTGSSKVPLSGFSELQGMRGIQKFSIHKVGGSSGALMSAHTCFNSLDLPVYKNENEMREKLLYAISEGGGGFLFA